MAYRWKNDLRDHHVTDEGAFMNRRQLMAGAAAIGIGSIAGKVSAATEELEPNSYEDITSYNNYYEFGTGKDDPAKYAGALTTSPWTVKIDGMVDRPGDYAFDDIMSKMTIEDRLYRFRCVEAWSAIIPWNGFELSDLLALAGVQTDAKYVGFETLVRPEEMPGQNRRTLDWPYVEGLRMDEAMNPLTIMATGIYGKDILPQNGAPLRLVVPWKYGFKSIKSIVRITVLDKEPACTWNQINPREYGFYSNVNPEVDHPRWSQASERKIGGGLFAGRQPTLMMNGYADQVAGLYDGLDLRKNF